MEVIRAQIGRRHAMFPLSGYPTSRSPNWTNTDIRVLTSPAMGAEFVQFHLTMAAGALGKYPVDANVESFLFLLSGTAALQLPHTNKSHALAPGTYAFLPAGAAFNVSCDSSAAALLLRKRHEQSDRVEPQQSAIVQHESKVPAEPWMNNPRTRLQTLLPDELRFDMAMNIFTFDPGATLPFVETHVMEHGLFMLEGTGRYYLDGNWIDVQKDDFLWMGPYCPQYFINTGDRPAKYIYYKNVNREIGA